MRAWIRETYFKLRFFCLTGGCTEAWLLRFWAQLLDRDIHPSEEVHLSDGKGLEMWVSAFGSQVWVRHKLYEFKVNYSDGSGLYIHERAVLLGEPTSWVEAYREKARRLTSANWARSMKILYANFDQVEDRREQNTIDYRGATV